MTMTTDDDVTPDNGTTIEERAHFTRWDGTEWCPRCLVVGSSKRPKHQHGRIFMGFDEAERIRRVLGESE